jgi:integrative and conjugative element protein (TIGR02256 family)
MLYKNPLIWQASLLIEGEVLRYIGEFAQSQSGASEAGGILLGYRRGLNLHVTEATVPQLLDVSSSHSWWRRDLGHQRIATRRWKQSGQTLDYVGEWHTHPQSIPAPSNLDLTEWREICAGTCQPMVFVIVGTIGRWVGLGNERSIVSAAAMREQLHPQGLDARR